MFRRKVSEKWYIIPIIILGIHFIYRLIDQSQMISTFPLDLTNDLSSLLAQLFFLAKCGFHKICPYWYNGYEVLRYYAPGWFYFTFPLYLLTKSVLPAAYLSLILMYILSFIFLIILSKTQKISFKKTILFFFLFFATPITIGNFIRLGRLHSMFAFMVLVPFITIILYYKDRKIDKKFFLLFIPIYVILLLSHQQEAIIFHFLIISLFLIKSFKENFKLIISVILGLILSSFWLMPFLKSVYNTNMFSISEGRWILDFTGQWFLTNIASFIIPLILIFVFYFYWAYNKYKNLRELIFYSPILILNILFLIRLTAFIPILDQIEPDTFMTFFLFVSIFLFLKIKYFPIQIKKLIIPILVFLALLSVSISILHTPLFCKHTELETNTLNLLKNVKGKFLILKNPSPTSYPNAYYSYAPIYYNLSTPSGWAEQVMSVDYKLLLKNLVTSLEEEKCEDFLFLATKLNLTSVITYNEYCNILDKCEFKEIDSKENICLYVI